VAASSGFRGLPSLPRVIAIKAARKDLGRDRSIPGLPPALDPRTETPTG